MSKHVFETSAYLHTLVRKKIVKLYREGTFDALSSVLVFLNMKRGNNRAIRDPQCTPIHYLAGTISFIC